MSHGSGNPVRECTRRGFLAGAAASVLSGTLRAEPAASSPAGRPQSRPALSRVTLAESDRIVVGRMLHPAQLREMITESLQTLTGRAVPADAWHQLLKPDDTIAIKANHSGAEVIGTTPPIIDALMALLKEAGWGPEKIVLIEVPMPVQRSHNTLPAREGWQPEETDFGSGRDRLAAVLDQVSAIINLPFIKSHNIAGMTCGLKNLSHALIKHPAKCHANGCSPYIGDIVALPQIRSKLKLTIVNGFRVVFDGGPEAIETNVLAAGRLLMGTDPVATDTAALTVLDAIRRSRNLPPIGRNGPFLDYLDRAAEKGLGTNDLDAIDVKRINLGE
jgi:uncharacterized protein (DUF362 family)